MSTELEQHYTDKQFCERMSIDRATSARWRDLGIIGHLKLPNGQIRYSETDIAKLKENFYLMEALGVTLKDLKHSLESRVVDIRVAKSGNNGGVSKDA